MSNNESHRDISFTGRNFADTASKFEKFTDEQLKNLTFIVECPQLPQRSIKLKLELYRHAPGQLDDWPVVWVDSAKFIQAWRSSPESSAPLWIPPWADWKEEKQRALIEYLTIGPPAFMPRVSCSMFAVEERRWLGLRRQRKFVPAIAFTNGRHRSVCIHGLACVAFPVQVPRSHATLLQDLCGATQVLDP